MLVAMRVPVALLIVLLIPSGGSSAATFEDEKQVLDLFTVLPQQFVVESIEDKERSRIFRLRSAEPIGRSAAGPIHLRAALEVSRLSGAEAAAAEVERRLAAADPDTGLSYAWDLVASHAGSVLHLHAACTFSQEAFLQLALALGRQIAAAADEPPASFWCRCGGACRSDAPLGFAPAPSRKLPPVRRSAEIEAEEQEWDNRLDPSGDWSSDMGDLSLMHYSNRLSFSYSAVFGATAHICEGAGVAGLVGRDRYEYGDEQGTVALVIGEREVSLQLVDGIASFCGAGWAGDHFEIAGFQPPSECAVTAERSHFHVVDHLNPEPRPAYVARGDHVQATTTHHTTDEEWLLARWPGPVITTMGLLRRGDLDCPTDPADGLVP
jgi:hypothetical protein